MPGSFPNLQGQVSQAVDQFLRQLQIQINALQTVVTRLSGTVGITKAQADSFYSPRVTAAAIQANGSSPINVTNLLGRLAEPQFAAAPRVDSLPIPSDPFSQDGGLVSYQQVVYRFDGAIEPGVWRVIGAVASIITDTHANRVANYPAANYPLGTIFYESDRNLLYKDNDVAGTNHWQYLYGEMPILQASIAALVATLGQDDDGLQLFVTNYNHRLRWVYGAGPGAFTWGAGETGSGYKADFAIAPTAVGWILLNGLGDNGLGPVSGANPIKYLLATGAVVNITSFADITGGVYARSGAAFTGTVVAGVTAAATVNAMVFLPYFRK